MLTAALSAASLTSFAQVYSVNVVGYVNQTIPAGQWAILANPLNNGTNGMNDVIKLPDTADGVTVYRYDDAAGAFKDAIQFVGGFGWFSPTDPAPKLAPGEGFFIQNTTATPLTITFVGEVPQGQLVNALPGGKFALKSSIVPQSARLTALEFPAAEGDTVYTFNLGTQAYANAYIFIDGYGWDSANPDTNIAGPEIPVGTGFWVQKSGTTTVNWTRNFTVN